MCRFCHEWVCRAPSKNPEKCCRILSGWRVIDVSAAVAGHGWKDVTMKYFVLLAGYGEMPSWDELSAEQQEAEMGKHVAFDEACTAREGVEILSGEALGDGSTATTLRTRGGEFAITDGPFAEAAEQIGGFYVIDAPNLDTVVELCQVLPDYDIEIRPVLDVP